MRGMLVVLTMLFFVWIGISGVAGGIWLVFKGDWQTVATGIGYSLIAPWVFGAVLTLALLPSFAWPGFMTTSLAMVVGGALMLLPAVLVFLYAMDRASGDEPLPYLMWATGTSLAPWLWMRGRVRGADDQSGIAMAMLTFACLGMAAAILLGFPVEFSTLLLAGGMGAAAALPIMFVVGALAS